MRSTRKSSSEENIKDAVNDLYIFIVTRRTNGIVKNQKQNYVN